MAIPVMEFQVRGYKIRNMFAKKSTYPKKIIEFWELVSWGGVKECQHFTFNMALQVMEFQDKGYKIKKGFCLKINLPKGNYWILRAGLMQLLGFWNFFHFFQFFPLKLVYFWTKSRKNVYEFFSTRFVPLISILASKIMEVWNNQL
jgi:hypothetical protein